MKTKIVLISTFFVITGITATSFALALEISYPALPAPGGSVTEIRTLPDYVRYIFIFAVAISGFIAFGALVWGGIRYLTSLGNPSKMADAQDQIVMAFLGVLIALGAFWLLNTINPQLVVLKFETTPLEQGIILCASNSCSANPSGELGIDFIKVRRNMSCIRCEYPQLRGIKSAYFFNSSDEVQVDIYADRDFKPEPPAWTSKGKLILTGRSIQVGDGNSIKLSWRMPGVYLFAEEDCQGEVKFFSQSSATMTGFDDKAKSIMIIPKIEEKTYIDPMSGIPVPLPAVTKKFGAILHESENYTDDAMVWFVGPEGDPNQLSLKTNSYIYCENIRQGDAACQDKNKEPYCSDDGASKPSSITLFQQVILNSILGPFEIGQEHGNGVTVFSNFQFNEQQNPDQSNIHCGPINAVTDVSGRLAKGKPLWIDGSQAIQAPSIVNDINGDGSCDKNELGCSKLDCQTLFNQKKISSIKVEGNYIAVLFREDGRGEVFGLPDRFPYGDENLKQGNHIGNDKARYLLVIPVAQK